MNNLRLVAALVLACALPASRAAALEAVCLPDRAAIGAGEQATLRALSDAPAGVSVTVAWSAEGGDIAATADPAVVQWRPARTPNAPHVIEAQLTANGQAATCTAQVAVLDSPRRGAHKGIVARPDSVTEGIVGTRTLLPPGVAELPGYGLYSYVLFARRPQTDEERERMEAVLKSFLLLNGTEAMEQAGVARSRLNATFLPIRRDVPDDFDQREDETSWLRNNYAFERSLALLLKLRDVSAPGSLSASGMVWVVSCLHPLVAGDDPRPVLVQELSDVPARLIPVWTARFAALTTQPRLYNQHALAKLSLDLRIVIAQAGDGLESVRGAFKLLGSSVLE